MRVPFELATGNWQLKWNSLPERPNHFSDLVNEARSREQLRAGRQDFPQTPLVSGAAEDLRDTVGRLLFGVVDQRRLTSHDLDLTAAVGDPDDHSRCCHFRRGHAEMLLAHPMDAVTIARHESSHLISGEVVAKRHP